MNLQHAFLLEISGRPEGSTLSHLKRIGYGRYVEIIPKCIREGLIEIRRKNTLGEDLYFISSKGKEFLVNPKEKQP